MAKVLYIVPAVGLAEEEKERREKLANSFLTNDKNKVIVEDIDEGPVSIESSAEEYISVGGTLKKLAETQNKYDVAIIGCAADAGLAPAKEFANIPVIGPLESSISVASMIGEKFSIITVLDSIVPSTWRTLRGYGMDHKCVSIEVINVPVLEINKSKEKVAESFLKEVKKIVETNKASSIVLGCMSLAFLPIDEVVKNKVDIPIINPAKVSIKVAEMLVSLGLKQSRISFPKTNYKKLKKSIFPNIDIRDK